jgi:hypothetical protein
MPTGAQKSNPTWKVEMNDSSGFDQFQIWLTEMDDAIARFTASVPSDVRQKLDGTDASLNALEQWLLSNYASPAQAVSKSQSATVDGAARYFGEIIGLATNSKWLIDLEDADSAFFRIPVLKGGTLKAPLCPLTTITASTDRRTGKFLSTILNNVRQPSTASR